MRIFELESALDGEPVILANGLKAYIEERCHPEKGYYLHGRIVYKELGGEDVYDEWWMNGEHREGISQLDIVGMWEYPKFNPPKPVTKIEVNNYYWYISNRQDAEHDEAPVSFSSHVECVLYNEQYDDEQEKGIRMLLANNQLFATMTDAEAWIEFMREYSRSNENETI